MSLVSPTLRNLLFVVGLTLVGLFTHSTHAGTGDEPHYLAISQSLAFDRDVDLSNNYAADQWIAGDVAPGAHVTTGRGGILRPVHDIGMPLLFAPYVAVVRPLVGALAPWLPASLLERSRVTPETIYRHLLSVAMIAVTLVLVAQLFRTLLALRVGPAVAFGATALMALSPPISIHGILFFTEILSALLCLVAFRFIVVDPDDRSWRWSVAGLCVGLLAFVHARNAGLVVALILLALRTFQQRRVAAPAAAFGSAAIAMLAIRAGVTYYFWGSWITTPHATTGAATSLASTFGIAVHRLGGLLIDQEYGLLIYAPIFLLAPLGALHYQAPRRALVGATAVVAAYLLPILLPFINAHGWTGGWSPAARFWVPVVPLLVIVMAAGLARAPRALVVPMLAVQIAVSAYFWQHPKNLWNDGDGIAAVCERGGGRFCDWLPSLVQPSDLVSPP